MQNKDRQVVFIATALTAILLTAMYRVGFGNNAVSKLPPNEIGDWLAGFASSLAFVWLVAGFYLQRIQLQAQREEFKRMAVVNCMAEVRTLVQSTIESEIVSFKTVFEDYKDDAIGFAWLASAVIRRSGHEPTASTTDNAVSDDMLKHAIYAVDICVEAMYQACRLYVETVDGSRSLEAHVSNLARRARLVLQVLDTYRIPYVSQHRLALTRLCDPTVDKVAAEHFRLYGRSSWV